MMPLTQQRPRALKSGSKVEEEAAVIALTERRPMLRHHPAVPAVGCVNASGAASLAG